MAQVLIALERALGQLEEPRADDRAVVPELRDAAEVEVVVARVHDLEALGVRLHQAVLDAVVDHLHVVAGARAADVEVAAFGREAREDGLEALHRLGLPADHEAGADLEAPDPARHARVDVVDPLLLQDGVAPHVVVEVGVTAVDDRVAGLEMAEQLLDLRLGRVAGGDHDPDRARLLELADELLDRERDVRAFAADLPGLLRRPVVRHDLVLVAKQPPDHVRAHPAKTDEADPHPYASVGRVARSVARLPVVGRVARHAGVTRGVSPQNRSDYRNTRMTVPPTKRKLRATAGASSARAGSHRRGLDRLDLVEPPNVARLAAERRVEEGACALDGRLDADHARTEREDVHVVVLDALVRRIGVVADGRSDARHLAGRDRRADAGTADQDPAVGSPGPDRRPDGLREVGIVVVRVRAVATEVDELVLAGEIGGKTSNELGLERCPGVVGGERDAHRLVLSRGRDRSRPTGRPRIRRLTASGAPPRRGRAAPRAPRRDRGTLRGPPAAQRSPRARP